jgi:hypothetical protein
MDASGLPTKVLSPWKKLAITALFWGAGSALMASAIVAGIIWYKSLPKPWDKTTVIVAKPPGFDVVDEGQRIEFIYTLENAGKSDFRIDSADSIRVFERTRDGTLVGPFSDKTLHVLLPVFVPAGQQAAMAVFMAESGVPTRSTAESDGEYHERIRTFLEQTESNLGGFAIFENVSRKEVELPRWRIGAAKGQK